MPTAERLIGRDDELRLIEVFVQDETPRGESLAISGEPGVGKTSLLEAACQSAIERGYAVLRVTGTEFESNISYSGLHQLLAPFTDCLEELVEPQRVALAVVLGISDEQPPPTLVLVSAVISVLRLVSSGSPILAAIDDVQWIDRASASILSLTCRRLSGTGIGIITTSRSGWQSQFDDSGLPALRLQALTDESSMALIEWTFPSLAAPVRRRVLVEARGNPLALLELPRALALHQSDGRTELPRRLPLTDRLQGLFGSQIRELPPATRQLLLYIALEGSGSLHRLAALSADDVLADLEPA